MTVTQLQCREHKVQDHLGCSHCTKALVTFRLGSVWRRDVSIHGLTIVLYSFWGLFLPLFSTFGTVWNNFQNKSVPLHQWDLQLMKSFMLAVINERGESKPILLWVLLTRFSLSLPFSSSSISPFFSYPLFLPFSPYLLTSLSCSLPFSPSLTVAMYREPSLHDVGETKAPKTAVPPNKNTTEPPVMNGGKPVSKSTTTATTTTSARPHT